MVDDQQVCRLSRLADTVEWANTASALDAVLCGATFILGGDASPHLTLRRAIQVDLSSVACASSLKPYKYLSENAQLIGGFWTAAAQALQAARAKVIRTSFENHGTQVKTQGSAQVGD